MNQQSLVHQFPILPIKWVEFLHLTPNEVHHSPFFLLLTITLSILFIFRLDLAHSYPIHLPTLIINYFTNLITILTIYLTNLAILLIIYLIDLTSLLT